MNLPVDPAPDFLLDPATLRAHVDGPVFERGLDLLRQQRVHDCQLARASSHEWRVEGLVGNDQQGSYSAVATLETDARGQVSFFSGHCTCAVGTNCRHSVALVLRAAYKSSALRATHATTANQGAVAGTHHALLTDNLFTNNLFTDAGCTEQAQSASNGAVPKAQITPTPQPQPQPQPQHPAPAPQATRHSPALESQAEPDAPTAPKPEQPEPPELPEPPSPPRAARWLDLFGPAATPVDLPATAPPAASEAPAAAQPEQLVYLLSPAQQGGHTVLQLGYGFCQRLRSGKWAKVRMPRPGGRLEAALEDHETIGLIETLSARTYSYPYRDNFGLLQGNTGARALRLAASTGRLFAMLQDRVLGMPLTLGAAHPLAWHWHEAATTQAARPSSAGAPTEPPPEPSWQLVPRLPDTVRGARWFANQPPLYLHEGSGVCGELHMPGVSADQLDTLMKAPALPQSALGLPEAEALRQLAGLPLPTLAQPAQVWRGVPATARLHISPVAAKLQPHLGLLRASLQFDYAGLHHYALHDTNPVLIETTGLPRPPANAGQPEPAAAEGTAIRVQLYRDLAFEKSAHQQLHTLGLAGDSAGQFCLPFQSGAEQNQWLVWLDGDFDVFKQAGFDITRDPGLASWIARADDLRVEMHAAPPQETAGVKGAAGAAGAANAQAGAAGAAALVTPIEMADATAPAALLTPTATSAEGGLSDSQSAWFNLSLGMSIGGQRQNILPLLPELLNQLAAVSHAAKIGSPGDASTLQLPDYIYLKQDGNAEGSHYLRLPCEPLRPWLQALLDLVAERSAGKSGDFKAESLRLSRLEALRMGNALGQGVGWHGAARLRDMVERLKGQTELPPVAAPAGLLAQLRPYQLQGLQWLQFLRANDLGGILADDMGLGKTLQTLAHILVEKQAGRLDLPCLIVAPVSLMGNWRQEAARFTPQLRVLVLHGAGRHEAAGEMGQHDIVLAPYSLLQRDRARWQQQSWHLVVLDEAQNIKNANSHAAQVAGELRTRHRLCLSGTPMENHLGELWSLFQFLMPGFLGSQARFKTLFRTPIEKHGDTERATQLRQRVTPFMLRRHKRDVATDLPDKQVAVSTVELGSAQADLYETIRLSTESAVREALASKGLGQSHIQVLDALLKLRQVCCDPRLVPLAAAQKVKSSAKLELLMELLPELLAEGRKVLLFSQFTSMLELIEQELHKRQLQWTKLTGQSQKRDQIIERFTSGEVPLFLISLKAGGVGLNLTQADTVIHYDPWWNPAAENQATDRAHRIGQTQRVMVYKLVAQGTIEERILALQERKAALAGSMYSGADTEHPRNSTLFTESDLEALLRPLGS